MEYLYESRQTETFDGRPERCTKQDQAYLAIVISILPQWAIITTLIVFMLIAFHNSLKAAIVYDNCSKLNAIYKYYVEIRTGDTSSTYNRRRTTLFIDMFDDNQTTLARITVPGHVIFGKKNASIPAIDDDKFYELRVTRFWLYRAQRLKKVSTIRITHTCTDSDSRIMVYGLEIRSGEAEIGKLFFPVMSNICAYGSVNRQNDSFDLESAGSIAALGGPHHEQACISNQLSWIDLTILTYFLTALVFYLTSLEFFSNSFQELPLCIAKGATAGLIAYLVTMIIGVVLRYYIKQKFSDKIGLGFWAMLYYVSNGMILLPASALWIYTTINTYRELCPKLYGMWVLSIIFALGECAFFALIHSLVLWGISLFTVRTADHYIIPEELNQGTQQEPPSRIRTGSRSSKQHMMQASNQAQSTGWQSIQTGQLPLSLMVPTGSYQQNMYPPQMPTMIMQPPTNVHNSYKTLQAAYPTTGYDTHPTMPANFPTYHQQTTTEQVNLQGIRAAKKIGSNESTGSTYYQQLMKNKGGVKSISQYGELLKQKKLVNKVAKK